MQGIVDKEEKHQNRMLAKYVSFQEAKTKFFCATKSHASVVKSTLAKRRQHKQKIKAQKQKTSWKTCNKLNQRHTLIENSKKTPKHKNSQTCLII